MPKINRLLHGSTLSRNDIFGGAVGCFATLAAWSMGAGVAAAGYGLLSAGFFYLITGQDRPFMIRWLIIIIATIQNLIAPHFTYLGAYDHYKYFMYVPQDEYMSVAVPGIIALSIGVLTWGGRREASLQTRALSRLSALLAKAPVLPFALLGLSFSGTVLASVAPAALGFVVYLLVNLKYSAAILILLSGRRDRYFWITAILGLALAEAVASSLLHDIMLWAVFFGGVLTYTLRISAAARILTLLVLMTFVIVLQSVKSDYRTLTWRGDQQATTGLYADLAIDRVEQLISGRIDLSEMLGGAVLRLNQGWIVSRVLEIVPSAEPHARGETVGYAFFAALVPRALVEDKAVTGGRENFIRFTHLELGENTSMGIGLLGEAYANFGRWGGAFFLLAYGFGLTLLVNGVLSVAIRYPIILAFIPNILLHAVKSETELLATLNFVVKSAAFHMILAWALIMLFRLNRSLPEHIVKSKPQRVPFHR